MLSRIHLSSRRSSKLNYLIPEYFVNLIDSPAARLQEERVLHEAKLAKMEAEMRMVFQQKVAEKEAKLKQSEEELYARHREMKEALEKQRVDLEDKKRRIESGRPLTPEKSSVSSILDFTFQKKSDFLQADHQEEGIPPHVRLPDAWKVWAIVLDCFELCGVNSLIIGHILSLVPPCTSPLALHYLSLSWFLRILHALFKSDIPSTAPSPFSYSFRHTNSLCLCRNYPVVADSVSF